MAAIIPAAAIGAAVGAELPKFFNDAFDQFGSGPGIYLRDGQPEGVVAQIGQAVGRAYCRAYDSSSDEYQPGAAVDIERACRPYLNSIGSPGGPAINLPFRGGQCLCSVYLVRADISYMSFTNAPVQAFLERRVTGPVVGVTVVNDPGSGTSRPLYTFVGNNVSDFASVSPTCLPAGTVTSRAFRPSQTSPGTNGITLDSVTITLISGPDDCGNPSPVVTVPPKPVNPVPPPFTFNPSPEIDIEIDIDVFPDGSVEFNIGTGPITVNPRDDGGDGGDGPGEPEPPPGPSDGPPGDVGEPSSPDETGDGGEASGCAPAGSVLVGVKLDIVDTPPLAREYEPGVFRGACYVYMGVLGNLDHDPAGAMLRDGQFVFAEKDNLTCYEVRATLGFNIRVTPYYRALEPEQ